MDPTAAPPKDLGLDPELLGHDPELASTVESLKKPRTAPALARQGSRRASPGLPSGFVIRALPIYGAIRRRLPWTLLGAVSLAIIGANTVAWGMVYLLRPSAFGKAAPAGRASAPSPSSPLAVGREQPAMLSALAPGKLEPGAPPVPHTAGPAAGSVTTPGPDGSGPVAPRRAPSRAHPSPPEHTTTEVVASEPAGGATSVRGASGATGKTERKPWFE